MARPGGMNRWMNWTPCSERESLQRAQVSLCGSFLLALATALILSPVARSGVLVGVMDYFLAFDPRDCFTSKASAPSFRSGF